MTAATAAPPPPTHAAFLRGMNLGGRRITNAELCAAFARLGFAGATAFLASGNVVFSAPGGDAAALEARLAAGLEAELGYPVPTYLRSAAEVRSIAARRPFSDAELAATAGKVQVALLAAAPDAAARRRALALATGADRLAFAGREVYWLPHGGVSGSDLDWTTVERALGATTVRTQRTVVRLAAKFFSGG